MHTIREDLTIEINDARACHDVPRRTDSERSQGSIEMKPKFYQVQFVHGR